MPFCPAYLKLDHHAEIKPKFGSRLKPKPQMSFALVVECSLSVHWVFIVYLSLSYLGWIPKSLQPKPCRSLLLFSKPSPWTRLVLLFHLWIYAWASVSGVCWGWFIFVLGLIHICFGVETHMAHCGVKIHCYYQLPEAFWCHNTHTSFIH